MWLIPSRRRPHNLARLIRTCSASGMTTPAWIRIDQDDPTLSGYEALAKSTNWKLSVGPRKPLSDVYNEAFQLFPNSDWYGFLADDVVPETIGFDRLLIEAAGKDGLAFGDDGINGGRHATHFVLGGDLVRSVGFLALPGLERLFIDTVWCDIARNRGVFRYLPNVKLTHVHFSNGLAPIDRTYHKPGKIRDKRRYESWRDSKNEEATR